MQNKQILRSCTKIDRGASFSGDSESISRDILSSLPQTVLITDVKGRLLHIPENSVRLFGYSLEKLAKLKTVQKLFGDSLSGDWSSFDDQFSDENRTEVLFRCESGEERQIELCVRELKHRSGQYVWICSDITGKKLVRDLLHRRSVDLDERMRELFCLYRISHLNQQQAISLPEFLQGAADVITESWRHPEVACVRISVDGETYRTELFEPVQLRESVDIQVGADKVGIIEIFYRKTLDDPEDNKFARYEKAMLGSVATTIVRFIEGLRATEALRVANEQLQVEQQALTEKNSALREVLNQIDNEKKQITRHVQSNVEKIIMPILSRLGSRVKEPESGYVDLLRSSLGDIASTFCGGLRTKFSNLSPREIEICHSLRNGLSCKEIAELNSTSVHTVLKQRQRIRKKLGIDNSGLNLVSFLESL